MEFGTIHLEHGLEAKRGYADRSIAAMIDYHAIADVEAYPRLRSQSILIPEQLYRRYFRPCDRKFTYPGLGPNIEGALQALVLAWACPPQAWGSRRRILSRLSLDDTGV
jgi:hypothetical protein